ncbi:MAG TPA: hypothetical protein VEW42_01230 [Candidatus Eisenbacteria bacterium]|nr:hypothetical protein [Candidatus Eisenbacteria bacterium]
MPRKKPEFADDPQEEKYEEVWDIRKIIAGVFLLLLLIVGGIVAKRILFHESLDPMSFVPKMPSVKGIATFNAPDVASHVKITLPSQGDVQNQIQNIQQQVTHLDVAEVASSSPQVQQIIKQLQQIPAGSVNQVKDMCVRLCNNL